MSTLDDVREIVASLPETIEKPSYGTPGFRVRDRLFAREREDGKCALVRFRDAGVVSTQGIGCTANNGPVEYVFYDRNGNNNADIKVCIEGTCDDFPWLNIWGY